MLYRVKVDLMFPNKSDGDQVWAALKNYLQTKNIKSLAEEKSFIEYHECHHDESPPQACKVIQRFER